MASLASSAPPGPLTPPGRLAGFLVGISLLYRSLCPEMFTRVANHMNPSGFSSKLTLCVDLTDYFFLLDTNGCAQLTQRPYTFSSIPHIWLSTYCVP